jgi:hypothetical protein
VVNPAIFCAKVIVTLPGISELLRARPLHSPFQLKGVVATTISFISLALRLIVDG